MWESFYKIRGKFPAAILKQIYFAFVHPYLYYGIELRETLHRETIKLVGTDIVRLDNARQRAKAKAYNTCRAPQAATATSDALVMSQAKLA